MINDPKSNFSASNTGVTLNNGLGNGSNVPIPFLIGNVENSIIDFNIDVPLNFTMCSITRYTTDRRRRILSARTNGNFLHGHWNERTYGQTSRKIYYSLSS